MKKLISIKEAATEVLGVSVSKLYELCSTGSIPHYRIDGLIKLDLAEIERWLSHRRVPMKDDSGDW